MAKKKYQVGGPAPVNQDTLNNDKLRQIREMQEKTPKEPVQTAKPKYGAKGASKTIRAEF